MKRFIVTTILIAVTVSILAYYMPRNFEEYVCSLDDNATVAIYCRQSALVGVDMGCGYKITCKASNFSDVVARCDDIDGVSVSFEGTYQDALQMCRFFAIRVSSEYDQDGLYVVCGKSPRIRNGIIDAGNVVNLQIAYRNGVICVGSPLILGDY